MSTKKEKLQIEVALAYQDTLVITSTVTEEEAMERLDRYDALVDELIELTGGEDSAFATDPMGSHDYKALLGTSTHGMSYNQMAEELGQFAFGG